MRPVLRGLITVSAFPLGACLVSAPNAEPTLIHEPDALISVQVGGLERTNSQAQVLPSDHPAFSRKLRVTIGAESTDTNATQLNIVTNRPVAKGDVLAAELWLRGERRSSELGMPMVELLFERSSAPWTKSATVPMAAPPTWRRASAVFRSAETYRPGEAMISIRMAFGPQTFELGGLRVVNHGPNVDFDTLAARAVAESPIGTVDVRVDRSRTHQTMMGLGGTSSSLVSALRCRSTRWACSTSKTSTSSTHEWGCR